MKEAEGITIKKKKAMSASFVLICVIAFIVIGIIAGVAAYLLFETSGEIGRSAFSDEILKIYNADQFVSAISANSKSGAEKKQLELHSDVVLTKEHVAMLRGLDNNIGEKGALLYGSLDGYGHSLTVNARLEAPLFSQICESGRVLRLEVICSEVKSGESPAKQLCALAAVNNGKIENVKLTIDSLSIGAESDVGGLVGYNYGMIHHCVVNVKEVAVSNAYIGKEKISLIWRNRVGFVATNNSSEGKVDGVFVHIGFPEDFVVLSMPMYNQNGNKNLTVGYAFSSCGGNVQDVFVVDGRYTITACDVKKLGDSAIRSVTKTYLVPATFENWTSEWKFSENPTSDMSVGDCLPQLRSH